MLGGHDLNSPGQDDKELIEALKAYHNWWHGLDSTWLRDNLCSQKVWRFTLSTGVSLFAIPLP